MTLKKTLALAMLLCITLGAQAQLLWKISGNGLERPSYIMGTHHLAPFSITDSIAALDEAIRQTTQVYGEIVMDDTTQPEMLAKMQQAMMLPQGTTLKSLYTPAQYDTLAAVVKSNIGLDLAQLDPLKPAALSAQLAVVLTMKALKGFDPQQQLDTWFQAEARKAGKKVGALETIEHQIEMLYNSQPVARQAKQLYCTATHLEQGIEQTQRLSQAYMAQDLDTLLAVMEEKMNNECDSTPEEEEALIFGRNADWAKQMPAIMQQAPTLFVVGAGHLPSERGVLSLLRAQGYTVEAAR